MLNNKGTQLLFAAGQRHSRKHRNYLLILWGAALLALVLRCLHIRQTVYSPVTDMRTYLQMVWWIFEGKYAQNLKWSIGYPPGYPFFLFIVEKLFGLTTLRPVGYVQAVVDAAAVLSLGAIGRRLVSAPAGLLAAYAWAIYHLAITSAALALTETLTADLLIFATHAFISYLRRPAIPRLVLTCVLVAALGHIRTNLLPICGVYAVFAAWHFWRFKRVEGFARRLWQPALFVLITFLLCIPWAIRNTRVSGRASFVSNNLGGMLLVGNNPIADGGFPDMRDAPKDVPYPSDDEQAMLAYGKAWFRSHPATEVFYLLPNRMYKLFTDDLRFWPWEEPVGGSVFEYPFGAHLYMPTLPYAPILWLGIAGFFLPTRRVPRFFLPVLWFSTWAALLLLNVQQRYRFISDPLLLIGAANLVTAAARQVRARKAAHLAAVTYVGLAIAGTFICWLRFGGGNLLQSTRASTSPEYKRLQEQHLTLVTDKNTTLPLQIALGSIPVNAGHEPDFYVTVDFDIHNVEFFDSGQGLNLTFDYLDAEGKRVTLRNTPYRLTANAQILSNYLEKPSTAWRIIRVPDVAKTLRMNLVLNSKCTANIRSVQVHGPVWSH